MTAGLTYLDDNDSELWLIAPGFDDLLLTGWTTDVDGRTFELMAMADDASWGSPQPVDVAVQRWMTDGAVASTQGQDNRTIAFTVRARANTSAELAVAEAALALRANAPCSLKWTPPAGLAAAPTVFEVWTWHLTHGLDFDDEMTLTRMYAVEATAKPEVRSADLTEVAAVTTGGDTPTTTEIDACTSLTGWTSSVGTPTVSGGTAIQWSGIFFGGLGPTTVSLTRTGSVTGLGSTPYLMVDVTLSGGFGHSIAVQIDGTTLAKASQIGSVSFYAIPTGVTSFSTLRVTGTATSSSDGASLTLRVADVSATDTIGGIGSHKQLARTLSVGGSVPTSGSIQVASPDDNGLGVVMVYTYKDPGTGYSPPMRQYRVGGASLTPATDAVSGQRETLVSGGTPATPITYHLPANNLPEGSYVVLGRFYATGTNTLVPTVKAGIGATALSAGDAAVGKVTWTTANTYQWGVVGVLALPNPPVPASSTLTLSVTLAATGTGTCYVDELYLLDVTHGAISLVDCGTATRLWLDAPDADPVRNRPAFYVGSQDDRSDAAGVLGTSVLARGDHDLDPLGAAMLTVCEVDDAAVSASFYQRWHTHAAA